MTAATEEVIDWMLQGASGGHIIAAIGERFPALDVKTLMNGAAKHFENTAKADIGVLRGWCLEATRDLYRRLIDVGDYPNALRAVKQMRDFTK